MSRKKLSFQVVSGPGEGFSRLPTYEPVSSKNCFTASPKAAGCE